MEKITEYEIENILKKLENEYEFSLTEKQVKNIAKRLNEYKFNTKKQRLLALEYSCRIKNEINNYIDFNVHNNNLKKYYSYKTIDYSINKVLDILNNNEVNHINNNSNLENNILFIESLLRIEINQKKLILSDNK